MGGWVAAVAIGCGSAPVLAQPALDEGNWEIRTNATTNGKAEPPQDQEECLRDELKDLSAYFAPALEGVQAKCTRTRQPSSESVIAYKMKCTGSKFTMDVESSIKVEGPKRFTATLKLDTKTPKERAVVVASIEGRHTGPCKGK